MYRGKIVASISLVFIVMYMLLNDSFVFPVEVDSRKNIPLPKTPEKIASDPKCGPRSLLAICQLLGVEARLDELCKLSGLTNKGTTMYGLYEAAQKKGLKAEGLKLSMDELANLDSPAIAHIEPDHFFVVEDVIGNNIRIIDPPKAPYILTKKEFQKSWDGKVLVVSKIQDKLEGEGPTIVFEELLYDFGEQDPDQDITHIFRFWNGGKEDLVVDKVESSCGCPAALLSSKTVQPGGVGDIAVTHDLKGRRGKDTQNVTVHTNDPNSPVLNLTLTGIVKAEVMISPNKIYFGNVSNKTSQVKEFYVMDPGDGKLEVTKVETGNKLIVAQVQSAIVQGEHKRIPIKVTLNPGSLLGRLTEKLTLYTNNEKKPKIELPIEGNIIGDIVVFPEAVFYGIINKDTQPIRKVILTSNNGTKFKIQKVEKDTEEVTTNVKTIEEGKNYELIAQLNPNGIQEKIKGLLKVYTDNKEQPIIAIPVHGLIQE